MANPVEWHGQNRRLVSPKDADYPALNTFNNGKASVSCWQLTSEELNHVIQSGGKLFIAVLSGLTQYPMFVGSEDTVRETVLDTGKVWDKRKSLDDKPFPAIVNNECPNCKITLSDTPRSKEKYCPTCDTLWQVIR